MKHMKPILRIVAILIMVAALTTQFYADKSVTIILLWITLVVRNAADLFDYITTKLNRYGKTY